MSSTGLRLREQFLEAKELNALLQANTKRRVSAEIGHREKKSEVPEIDRRG